MDRRVGKYHGSSVRGLGGGLDVRGTGEDSKKIPRFCHLSNLLADHISY